MPENGSNNLKNTIFLQKNAAIFKQRCKFAYFLHYKALALSAKFERDDDINLKQI